MELEKLMANGINVTISVTLNELKEFADALIYNAMEEAKKNATTCEGRIFTAAEAARYLGVSTNTLWRWERDGYLVPISRIGHSPRYSENQLKALKGGVR